MFARLLIGTLVFLFVAGASRAQSAESSATPESEIAAYLGGAWTVKVGSSTRERVLQVRGAAPPVRGLLVTARYGASDAKGEPTALVAREEGGRAVLEGRVASGSQIRAEFVTANRAEGRIVFADGRSFVLGMTRTESEPPSPRAANPRLAAMLAGTWQVKVGDDARLRRLHIRDLVDPGNAFMPQADYGWADQPERLAGVRLIARRENDAVGVELMTQAGSSIVARAAGPDRLEGSFTNEEGREFPVVLSRGLMAPPGRGDGKLTLIYVGASNCGPCREWETSIGGPHNKRAFLATPEGKAVEFREVKTTLYSSTGRDEDWPDDLRWVRAASYVASGTPRFVLVRGGRVLMNDSGTRAPENKLRPRIRELMK